MKVLKFGGTSVGSAENISKVLDILSSYSEKGIQFASVFSAVGGMTNKLIEMSTKASTGDETYKEILTDFENTHYTIVRELIPAKDQSTVFADIKRLLNDLEDQLTGISLIKELSNKSLDFILSHGERVNVRILTAIAQLRGLEVEYLDARKLIKTDSTFGKAKIDFALTNKNIQDHFSTTNKIQFITGFVSSDENNITTTLGRGGSDFTAAVFASALDAEDVEIWTDVDGVMTADPRRVKNAFTLPAISYIEAMEMSHFGAKVIYPPTLLPVITKKIPVWIKNTFNPESAGTIISEKSGVPNKMRVKGISSISDVALVTMLGSGMVGIPGVSARMFGALARQEVSVILITQASSEQSITFAVSPDDAMIAKKVIKEEFFYEIEAKRIEDVKVKTGLSIVAIIGENMTNTPGISGRMFHTLGINGVNISAIAQGSSELNLSVVISKSDISKALNALHDAYFLAGTQTLNVFMVGPGLIGATLLDQIKDQKEYLAEKKGVNINVVAIANSRKLLVDANGIDLTTWKEELSSCENPMSFEGFVQAMKDLNLPNSVFVDNTSNKDLIRYYDQILDASVHIVTPNKVANSSEYAYYKKLQDIAFKRNVQFLYETNVGAGLPVVRVLQDLMHSGDEVLKIEGVLSGSLSFIFNTYDGSTTFKDIVLQAKDAGFTEPDPRDDLNGMDVARKILILGREAGLPLEMEDINVNNILPQSCIDAPTVDAFFEELEKSDGIFKKMSDDAKANNQKLCFVATLAEGKVNVDLVAVGADHPFSSLSGSDNMISYTTKRYEQNPLVIKGPGAGAEVTAAGVFADMISISNSLS
jgi:aspartokinase/homoserine dehydrogenase 1